MRLSCTVFEKLSLIFQKLKRSRDNGRAPLRDGLSCVAWDLLCSIHISNLKCLQLPTTKKWKATPNVTSISAVADHKPARRAASRQTSKMCHVTRTTPLLWWCHPVARIDTAHMRSKLDDIKFRRFSRSSYMTEATKIFNGSHDLTTPYQKPAKISSNKHQCLCSQSTSTNESQTRS